MSLDKAIEHRKEYRKPYYGSKACDPSCRNHGGCSWCEENRKHKFRDKHPTDVEEYWNDISDKKVLEEIKGGVGLRPICWNG